MKFVIREIRTKTKQENRSLVFVSIPLSLFFWGLSRHQIAVPTLSLLSSDEIRIRQKIIWNSRPNWRSKFDRRIRQNSIVEFDPKLAKMLKCRQIGPYNDILGHIRRSNLVECLIIEIRKNKIRRNSNEFVRAYSAPYSPHIFSSIVNLFNRSSWLSQRVRGVVKKGVDIQIEQDLMFRVDNPPAASSVLGFYVHLSSVYGLLLHIPFMHEFTAFRFVFLLLTLVCWCLWKKVITSKTQCNAENACGNRMWQLCLTHHQWI